MLLLGGWRSSARLWALDLPGFAKTMFLQKTKNEKSALLLFFFYKRKMNYKHNIITKEDSNLYRI
jgi:hypothetical protein